MIVVSTFELNTDYIKEEIDNDETRLKWVSSGDQLADIFTKALQGQHSFIYATKSSPKSLKHRNHNTNHTRTDIHEWIKKKKKKKKICAFSKSFCHLIIIEKKFFHHDFSRQFVQFVEKNIIFEKS